MEKLSIEKLIAKQEKNETLVEHQETFDEMVNEYLYVSDPNQKISIDEKMAILTSKLNSKNIKGIDYLSYIIQLINILFTEEERKNNVNLAIIKDNTSYNYQNVAIASVILTINKKDFIENPEYNVYYYFDSNVGILPISKSRLQDNFNEKIYEYIEEDNYKIPGIERNKVLKK